MVTKDTLVEVWEAGRLFSSGPSRIRKPTAQEIEQKGGYGQNSWICHESFHCIVIQHDMPYKNIFFWHEKGHLLYDEKYDITHHYKYAIERFCDDFMLLICGWKRTMAAQLWGLSEDVGLNSVYQRRRVLAQVGVHGKEFLKMVNDRIEMLDKRLFSKKYKTDMEYEVDDYWMTQLRKIKEEFGRQEKGIR